MLWGSLFPYHISQPKIRSTVLNWGVGLLAGTPGRNLMLKLNFSAFEVHLFYFKFCFLEGGSCIFSLSLELTISWQHHPWQPVLLQFGGALLIYWKHRLLQLSQAPAAWMSCTSRVPTWHLAPAPRNPRAVSADAKGGLQLLQAPLVYLCHAAAPPRSIKIRLPTFSAPFGEPLSASLTISIPPPLLHYRDADGQGTQTPPCNPRSAMAKTGSLWKPS